MLDAWSLLQGDESESKRRRGDRVLAQRGFAWFGRGRREPSEHRHLLVPPNFQPMILRDISVLFTQTSFLRCIATVPGAARRLPGNPRWLRLLSPSNVLLIRISLIDKLDVRQTGE